MSWESSRDVTIEVPETWLEFGASCWGVLGLVPVSSGLGAALGSGSGLLWEHSS